MSADTDDFRTLLQAVFAGCPDAADRFCRAYQKPIQRVVRARLLPRMRSRFDSLDFVNDVWASFFTNPPRDGRFDSPDALVAYLARMAQFKIAEAVRQQTGAKHNVNRERALDDVARPGGGLAADQPTPSQIVGAEDEWEHLLEGQKDPVHRQILTLLRQGLTYREIAAALNTNEKTVQRLVRRLHPGTRDT